MPCTSPVVPVILLSQRHLADTCARDDEETGDVRSYPQRPLTDTGDPGG